MRHTKGHTHTHLAAHRAPRRIVAARVNVPRLDSRYQGGGELLRRPCARLHGTCVCVSVSVYMCVCVCVYRSASPFVEPVYLTTNYLPCFFPVVPRVGIIIGRPQ